MVVVGFGGWGGVGVGWGHSGFGEWGRVGWGVLSLAGGLQIAVGASVKSLHAEMKPGCFAIRLAPRHTPHSCPTTSASRRRLQQHPRRKLRRRSFNGHDWGPWATPSRVFKREDTKFPRGGGLRDSCLFVMPWVLPCLAPLPTECFQPNLPGGC